MYHQARCNAMRCDSFFILVYEMELLVDYKYYACLHYLGTVTDIEFLCCPALYAPSSESSASKLLMATLISINFLLVSVAALFIAIRPASRKPDKKAP